MGWEGGRTPWGRGWEQLCFWRGGGFAGCSVSASAATGPEGRGCPRLCWVLLRFRAWGGGQLLAPSPAHFPLPSHPPSPKQAGGKEGSGVAAPSLCLAQGLGCRNVRLFPPHIPPTRHGVFLPLIFESSHQYSNKAGAAPRLCALLAAQQGQGCATATPLCYPHQALRGTEGRAAPHHHTEPDTTYLPLPAASRGILRPQRISGVSAGEWEQANRVQDRQQHVAGQHPEHGAGVLVTPLLLCPGCQEVQSPFPPPPPPFPTHHFISLLPPGLGSPGQLLLSSVKTRCS